MRRKWIITVLLLGVSISSFSQGTIKGKLIDSIAKQPMSLATITVFKAKDTSIVTYRLSDPQGNFKVPGLPFNIPLRTVITSSGYKVIRRSFTLTSENALLDFGTIGGYTDTTSLEEFLVIAERPPVTIRKDTIEFNAAAFKTLPSALVEDLLKKFPGVEVAADGSIKVNGRAVNRILVDGRDFFGGDPRIATRNLPANLIDKVQVMDDKEQLRSSPDIDKTELGQVINLKFKKSVKKGWFGKVYGGGGKGSVDHYEAGGIVNSFRDTLQVSILGYTNNINKAGFGLGDIMQLGGFQRSGANSVGTWSEGGIEINGISFGGTSSGIQRSSGAGININHDPTKKVQLNFQYFMGNIKNDYDALNRTSQFLNDTTLVTTNTTNESSDNYTHRFSTSLKWEIDTLSSFKINPSFSISKSNGEKKFKSESGSNYDSILNNSNNYQKDNASGHTFENNTTYNKRFRKNKGALFISQNIRLSALDNTNQNDVLSTFYKGGVSTSVLNQLRNNGITSKSTGLYISINQKLNKRLSVTLSNSIYLGNEKNILRVHDLNPFTGQYEMPNLVLSNGLEQKSVNNVSGLRIPWHINKLTITSGLDWQVLNIQNIYEKAATINQKYQFLLPNFSIRWNVLNLTYRLNVIPPSTSNISPIIDNTNPLYQNLGNPNLKPSKRHLLYGGVHKYDTKRLIDYDFYSNISYTTENIIRERYVSSDGVQITRPINIGDMFRWNTDIAIEKQFKFSQKWKFSIRPGFFYNLGRSYVKVNGIRSATHTRGGDASLNFNFNWDDKFEFTNRYSIYGSRIDYDDNAFRDVRVTTKNVTAEVVVRAPKNWVWESSIDYRHNPIVSPGIAKDIFRWNAGLNFLFLKEQKGQLKLFVYDILKQNTNSFRMVAENFIQDTNAKTLTRYFLLTFTYNIREFKEGKVGSNKSLFYF